MKPAVGICDLCNTDIASGGYVFYSTAVMPTRSQETGLMHICDACTEKYINDERFERSGDGISVKVYQADNDLVRLLKTMQEVNAWGIIEVCRSHGFTPRQAKEKARAFVELFWQDKQQCIREATEFWTSKPESIWVVVMRGIFEIVGLVVKRTKVSKKWWITAARRLLVFIVNIVVSVIVEIFGVIVVSPRNQRGFHVVGEMPCFCGSGKRYKNCHGLKRSQSTSNVVTSNTVQAQQSPAKKSSATESSDFEELEYLLGICAIGGGVGGAYITYKFLSDAGWAVFLGLILGLIVSAFVAAFFIYGVFGIGRNKLKSTQHVTLPTVTREQLHHDFGQRPREPSGAGGRQMLSAINRWNRGGHDIELDLQAAVREGLEGAWLSTAYCLLGQIYVKKGDLLAAVDQFLKCLAIRDRDSGEAWQSAQRLYYIYDEAGRSKEAAAVQELAEIANKRHGWAHTPAVEAELRKLARQFLASDSNRIVSERRS